MSCLVTFTSAAFLPILPETSQIRPGLYGFELAYWLAKALYKRGLSPSYPGEQRTGWDLDLCSPEGYELALTCSCLANVGDGYVGKALNWEIRLRQPEQDDKFLKSVLELTLDALGEAGTTPLVAKPSQSGAAL